MEELGLGIDIVNSGEAVYDFGGCGNVTKDGANNSDFHMSPDQTQVNINEAKMSAGGDGSTMENEGFCVVMPRSTFCLP